MPYSLSLIFQTLLLVAGAIVLHKNPEDKYYQFVDAETLEMKEEVAEEKEKEAVQKNTYLAQLLLQAMAFARLQKTSQDTNKPKALKGAASKPKVYAAKTSPSKATTRYALWEYFRNVAHPTTEENPENDLDDFQDAEDKPKISEHRTSNTKALEIEEDMSTKKRRFSFKPLKSVFGAFDEGKSELPAQSFTNKSKSRMSKRDVLQARYNNAKRAIYNYFSDIVSGTARHDNLDVDDEDFEDAKNKLEAEEEARSIASKINAKTTGSAETSLQAKTSDRTISSWKSLQGVTNNLEILSGKSQSFSSNSKLTENIEKEFSHF